MNVVRRTIAIVLVVLARGAAENQAPLTQKLWPRERIGEALEETAKLKAAGMMSEKHYRRKKEMLEARLAGTFKPTMLSTTNPPLNFI